MNGQFFVDVGAHGAPPGAAAAIPASLSWLPLECVLFADEPSGTAARVVAESAARIAYTNYNPLYFDGARARVPLAGVAHAGGFLTTWCSADGVAVLHAWREQGRARMRALPRALCAGCSTRVRGGRWRLRRSRSRPMRFSTPSLCM